MNLQLIILKITNKVRYNVIRHTRNSSIYPFLYRSYWHYLFLSKHQNLLGSSPAIYYAARPNPGAGIGHQMANWISGKWYAQLFRLKFAHLGFSSPQWEHFLGFGIGEKTVDELKKQGYKTRKLPLFDERNTDEVNLNRKIIQSYAGKKRIFIAEQDQSYQAQYEIMDLLKTKFYSAPARTSDRLIYNKQHFNIAIHVRRGDIMIDTQKNANLSMRFQNNNYFEQVLQQVVTLVRTDKPIHIYFFSQGKPENYPEFARFANLHWCLDMTAKDSFLHMTYADLLITSKSSFSYKPALLNNGIKVCPQNFWHHYPDAKEWILCQDDGTMSENQLRKLS